MKTRPMGAELFHADGQAEIQDEVNSCFSQFLRVSPIKIEMIIVHVHGHRFVPEGIMAIFTC